MEGFNANAKTADKWAIKDRLIVKQAIMKSVLESPGLGVIAPRMSLGAVDSFYAERFKAALKALDETS